MELESNDDLEVDLESAVVTALSNLQKKKKGNKYKIVGVSCKNIVKFLKANCSWVDGDLDSQVMTALLSCVKTGVVCALDQGSYRLVNPISKNMISKCVNRVSHGPKCSCLTTLRGLISYRRPCCVAKGSIPSDKKTTERKKKVYAEQKYQRKRKRRTKRKQKTRRKCAKPILRSIGMTFGKSAQSKLSKKKCEYCLEIHYMPGSRRLYKKCKSFGTYAGVPVNKFSPRDETNVENTANIKYIYR